MKAHALVVGTLLAFAVASAADCDFTEYKEAPGLRAQMSEGTLRVNWQGERGQELRAAFVIDNDQPLIRELATRKSGGNWLVLGRDLRPEFAVTTGIRRISEQQLAPLRELGRQITPEIIEKEKWN